MTCDKSNRHMTSLPCGRFHVLSRNDYANDFSRLEQENGSSPVRILSCVFNEPFSVKDLLHFEQANGFSLQWILSWFFKAILCIKWLRFLNRQMAFPLCGSFHAFSNDLFHWKKWDLFHFTHKTRFAPKWRKALCLLTMWQNIKTLEWFEKHFLKCNLML